MIALAFDDIINVYTSTDGLHFASVSKFPVSNKGKHDIKVMTIIDQVVIVDLYDLYSRLGLMIQYDIYKTTDFVDWVKES